MYALSDFQDPYQRGTMEKKCLKCGYERSKEDRSPEYECPKWKTVDAVDY